MGEDDGLPGVLSRPPWPRSRMVRAEGPRVALNFGRDTLAAHELVAWLGARHRLRDVTFLAPHCHRRYAAQSLPDESRSMRRHAAVFPRPWGGAHGRGSRGVSSRAQAS